MTATPETLYTCPVCHQANFSWRGLRAHCCRAKADRGRLSTAELIKAGRTQPLTMPKAKLSVVDSVALASALPNKQQLARLQQAVAEQITIVGRVEHENIVRRVVIGMALRLVKDSPALGHGKWMPWLKKNAPGKASYRQCNFMMRIADVWLAQSQLAPKDIAALPASDYSLDLQSGALRKLAASVEKFVGDTTWGELLAEHGIRDDAKLGGARDAKKSPAPDADEPDADQLYFQYRDEIGSALTTAEQLLLKDNALQHLAGHPEEIRGVVEGLRALADKVEAAAKPLIAQ